MRRALARAGPKPAERARGVLRTVLLARYARARRAPSREARRLRVHQAQLCTLRLSLSWGILVRGPSAAAGRRWRLAAYARPDQAVTRVPHPRHQTRLPRVARACAPDGDVVRRPRGARGRRLCGHCPRRLARPAALRPGSHGCVPGVHSASQHAQWRCTGRSRRSGRRSSRRAAPAGAASACGARLGGASWCTGGSDARRRIPFRPCRGGRGRSWAPSALACAARGRCLRGHSPAHWSVQLPDCHAVLPRLGSLVCAAKTLRLNGGV